jgi:hypothetical protein
MSHLLDAKIIDMVKYNNGKKTFAIARVKHSGFDRETRTQDLKNLLKTVKKW